MHLQRIARQAPWLLPILLVGCTSTTGSQFGGTAQSKSIAVVGEQTLPATTGEPGGKVTAESEPTEPRRNPRTRISGRVVDEMGEPIAGATVRLADSGSRGGKEILGTSDRSGAFTLNGLRAGSTYVLIAEVEDEEGPLIGRIEARTAETGVEIGLSPESGKGKVSRRSARSAQARPVSSREESGGVPDEADRPTRINREDVAPPAENPDGQGSIDPGPQPDRVGRPQLSKPEPGIGWRNRKDATASRSRDEESPEETTTPDRPRLRTSVPANQDDRSGSDDEDPLPPALQREAPGAEGESTPASARSNRSKKVGLKAAPKSRESGEITLAPEVFVEPPADRSASVARVEAANVENHPATPATFPGRPTEISKMELSPEVATAAPGDGASPSPGAGPQEFPPIGSIPTEVAASLLSNASPPPTIPASSPNPAPKHLAPEPVFASQAPALAGSPINNYDPFARVAQIHYPPDQVVDNPPLQGEGSTEAGRSTEVEAPRRKWGELAATDRPASPPASALFNAVVEPTKAVATGPLARRKRSAPEGRNASVALCSYDSRTRKLGDFALPDLEGKLVRFQDLDADFVLLDFWGTWCGPCLDSIPHLVELQKKYGPGRLKVVGIACEDVPPDQRKAKVDEVARQLGINYPILLSTMDGKPCPVQRALQVQAMPTMILVDRRGQVLWRDSGSTPAVENRLDRILALSMSRGETVRR